MNVQDSIPDNVWNAPVYGLSERVVIKSNQLTGRVIENSETIDGEIKYVLLLDDENATEDGTYCARESEIRRPQE